MGSECTYSCGEPEVRVVVFCMTLWTSSGLRVCTTSFTTSIEEKRER